MANTLNLGTNGNWATKKDSLLAYNSENGNFKPLPFDFDRASSATRVNKDGLIETVGSGEPRIDFSNDSKGALKLEPSRTNLITYSEDFTQWSKNSGGIVVTDNTTDVISPSGSTNASKVDFGSSNRIIFQSPTLSGVYSGSVYVKGIAGETIRFSVGAVEENFTLTGGWDRILKENITASANTFNLNTYGGVTARTIYVWGAQLEQGSYATSYIPTQGGSVTRVADVCNNGANEQVINSTEGVLYVETSALSNDLSERRFGLSDGTSSNVVRVGYTSVSNRIIAVVYNGSNQAVMTYTSPDITQNSKIAVKYKENDFALWVDGVKRSTDTSGSVFSANTLNSLDFNIGGGSHFYSETKDVRVYNTALTDAELQALTTI